jgi:ATP-binding cassette subfamily B protein
MEKLRSLAPYFRPYLRRLLVGLAAILAGVALGLAAPLLVGRAVDAFQSDASATALLRYAALLVGVTLARGAFNFAQRLVLVTLSRDIELDLRNDYFAHLERLPQSFYHERSTGDLMARATNDLQAVRMLCGPAIMYSTATFFTAAGSLFFMLSIHSRLTLLALAPMPLVAVATQFFGKRIHTLFQRVQEQFGGLTARVQENLAGLRVVRAYVREEWEQETFDSLNEAYVDRNRQLIAWSSAFHPLLQALVGMGFVAVLWYGGRLVVSEAITIGEFVTFNFFLGRLVWPMIAVGWVVNLVQRGTASLERIRQVFETPPEIRDEPPLACLVRVRGEIEIRNLTFTYRQDAPPALEDVELRLEAGRTAAVVGRTGAGKSTLLGLLPRLFDPPPGAVLLDGVDVRRIPLATLRRAIAVVSQETFLFSATVGENIAFGRPESSSGEVMEAARFAGLEEDLVALPDGLDTVVGERGINLSGGQKQRVALARALLLRPRVLLLDDCFSAVDTQTEERVLANLRRPMVAGRSHRDPGVSSRVDGAPRRPDSRAGSGKGAGTGDARRAPGPAGPLRGALPPAAAGRRAGGDLSRGRITATARRAAEPPSRGAAARRRFDSARCGRDVG